MELNQTSSNSEINLPELEYSFQYDIKSESNMCNLPKSLTEISALTSDSEGSLFAVNDEQGLIFKINHHNCEVVDQFVFGKKGDYEGIELVGTDIYISKSNGNLIEYNRITKEVTNNYKSKLSQSNDVEGLGYDFLENRLILACKGSPNIDKHSKLKKTKAFYAFDLATKQLIDTPVIQISDDDLVAYYEKHSSGTLSKSARRKLKNRLVDFSPSAIALHPFDNNFYILSSVGRLLIVCTRQSEILHVEFLDPNKFIQPEGICFDKDGTMYISNEGRSLTARILTFNYIQ